MDQRSLVFFWHLFISVNSIFLIYRPPPSRSTVILWVNLSLAIVRTSRVPGRSFWMRLAGWPEVTLPAPSCESPPLCCAGHCVLMPFGESSSRVRRPRPHRAPVSPTQLTLNSGTAAGGQDLVHSQEKKRIIRKTPVLETVGRGEREEEEERKVVMPSWGLIVTVSCSGRSPFMSRGPSFQDVGWGAWGRGRGRG